MLYSAKSNCRHFTVLLSVAVLLCLLICSGCNKTNPSGTDNTQDGESSEAGYVDAHDFYEEVGTIKEEQKASKSKEAKSEEEIGKDFVSRGFGDLEITYTYTMNGDLMDEEVIDTASEEKHPMYTAYYTAESGIVWSLVVVNGDLFATPGEYNAEAERNVPMILSETDTFTGYDVVTNQFFEIEPKEDTLFLKKVEKISASLLDSMTKEVLDAT